MSKKQLSAALILVALFGLPATAHAATPTPPAQSNPSVAVHAEPEDDEGEYEDAEDGEDGEDQFDDGDSDSDDSFVVPPVVIQPDGMGHRPPPVDGQLPPEEDISMQRSDVSGKHPVQVDKVHPDGKTPTDVFVDTALIGLGAVGAGAIGLGATVGVRAIRARRNGEKADYFYGD